MNDAVDIQRGQGIVQCGCIDEVHPVKGKPLVANGAQPVQSRCLQCSVVIRIEIVDAHDMIAPPQQPVRERGSDEPRDPGYEDPHRQ